MTELIHRFSSGVFVIAATPFTEDGALDLVSTDRMIDFYLQTGVTGLTILGIMGEAPKLTGAESRSFVQRVLSRVDGRVPVIVTTSHFSTQVVVDRAREAEALGAAMLMMMPPYHGVGLVPGEAAIFEHFAAASDAVSIPIMVQDAPLSGATLPVPLLVRMAKEIENVSYFKMETPFAADKLAALIEAGGEHIVGPFDGEEAVTLLADLDAGCTGTMTSALQPELIRPIVTEYRAGNVDAALAQWRVCLPLINHENRQCGLRAAKTVMQAGGVIGSDHVRHPLKPMTDRTRARLLQLAAESDVIALRWGK